MNKFFVILFFISSYISSISQYFDSTQLENINNTRIANEGDMYLDTNREDFRIGLSHGKLGKLTDDQKLSYDTLNNIIHLEDGDSVLLEKMITGPRFYIGTFQINSGGSLTVTGIPFEPTTLTFIAFANVDTTTLNSDNAVGNNNTGINNSFGYMKGYARNDNGTINQQVICGGGHGNSINDISRYASPSHAIGIRYGSQNGDNLGLTTAIVTTITTNSFTLSVDNYNDKLQVIFEAHR